MSKKTTHTTPEIPISPKGRSRQHSKRSGGLQRTHPRHRHLDALEAIIVVLDGDGRISYINQRGCKLLGRRIEDAMGQAEFLSNLVPPGEAKSTCPCFLTQASDNPESRRYYEGIIETKGIDAPQALWRDAWLDSRTGPSINLHDTGNDIETPVDERIATLRKANVRLKQEIEERKRAENALAEQKDFLNTLLETISNPVFYKDTHGKYIGCNRAFEAFIGKPRSEIIGKTVYDMGPEEIARKYHEKDLELFSTPGKQHYEWKIVKTDGTLREVIFDKATLLDNQGRITGLVGVISDITERKQAEDLVRNLSQMLIKAQENERQMISYELHDSIAQSLSSLKINCDTFFDDHSEISLTLKEKMGKHSKLIGQIINAVRNLSYGLHPPAIDQMGIVQALGQLCDDASEQTGLNITFRATGLDHLKPDKILSINLYRLVQEGLNNVRKHANARQVTVNLVAAHPNLILRIEDNGKGLDMKKYEDIRVRKKKMGLRSMKERVNLLQGIMQINTFPMKGTKITIKIPLVKNGDHVESENTNHYY